MPTIAEPRLRRVALAMAVVAGLGGCSTFESVFGSFGGGGKDDEDSIRGDRISVLELEQRLEADPRLASVEVVVPPQDANAEWAEPSGTPDHALAHLALSASPQRAWSVSAGEGSSRSSRLTAQPIVADGRVYVLDSEATISAFDAASGERLWRRDLTPEDERSTAGFGGGLATERGRLFAVTGFGIAFELDGATGEVRWQRQLGVPFRTSPTVVNGRVFATSYDNRMFALDGENGVALWTYRGIEEPAGVLSSTSPAVSGETVVGPFTSGELVALRIDNGKVAWSDSLTKTGRTASMSLINDIAGSPIVANGRVYAVSHSGRLVSIDLRTGERIWTRNIASIETPWLAGDFLYLVTLDAEIVCVSARDGRVKWITQLERWENENRKRNVISWAGPVLAGNRLYLVNSEEELVAVSPFDGSIEERLDLPSAAFIPPVVAGGTLYVLTDEAELVAFR